MKAGKAGSEPREGPARRQAPAGRDAAARWAEAAEALARWMEERDYRGYDPFDGARSPLARPLLRSRWASVAWIQLHRRLPVQLRPLVGVSPHRNPKTLALALQGHLRLAEPRDEGERKGGGGRCGRIHHLGRSLLELQEDGGWGYPFPWANRHFQVPAGTPASVPTAFAVHALMDLEEGGDWRTGELGPREPLEGAEEAARFLAEGLNRVPAEGGVLLSYTPLDRRAVHNASLLAASALARVGRRLEDEALLELARRVAAAGLRAQRADGSWPYGTSRRDGWVDSYHTGYILTALRHLRVDLGALELTPALERGFDFWRESFLRGPAVAPRPGRSYPVDAHALAQGVLTLLEFAPEREGAASEASRLAWWAVGHLRRPDGSFGWRRGRLLGNSIPYMRWVQAWMFRALSELAFREVP